MTQRITRNIHQLPFAIRFAIRLEKRIKTDRLTKKQTTKSVQ